MKGTAFYKEHGLETINKLATKVVITVFVILYSFDANSQAEREKVQLGADLIMPRHYRLGYGGSFKWIRHVSQSSSITISAGMFSAKHVADDRPKRKLRTIPVLAGYRYGRRGFYIEPQAGIGNMDIKISIPSGYAKQSALGIFWGSAVGFKKKHVDISLYYMTGHRSKNFIYRSQGNWDRWDAEFRTFGICIASELFIERHTGR